MIIEHIELSIKLLIIVSAEPSMLVQHIKKISINNIGIILLHARKINYYNGFNYLYNYCKKIRGDFDTYEKCYTEFAKNKNSFINHILYLSYPNNSIVSTNKS